MPNAPKILIRTSSQQLAEIACELRSSVGLPSRTRYRLAGVGLSGFIDKDDIDAQTSLFEAAEP